MKRDLIETILLALLDKTGERWKTVTGLLLGACALALTGIDAGWDVFPPAVDPWLDWTWKLAATLGVFGVAHKKLKDVYER